MGLLGVRLLFSPPVRKLRRIYAGDSDVKLQVVSNQRRRFGDPAPKSQMTW